MLARKAHILSQWDMAISFLWCKYIPTIKLTVRLCVESQVKGLSNKSES